MTNTSCLHLSSLLHQMSRPFILEAIETHLAKWLNVITVIRYKRSINMGTKSTAYDTQVRVYRDLQVSYSHTRDSHANTRPFRGSIAAVITTKWHHKTRPTLSSSNVFAQVVVVVVILISRNVNFGQNQLPRVSRFP